MWFGYELGSDGIYSVWTKQKDIFLNFSDFRPSLMGPCKEKNGAAERAHLLEIGDVLSSAVTGSLLPFGLI